MFSLCGWLPTVNCSEHYICTKFRGERSVARSHRSKQFELKLGDDH